MTYIIVAILFLIAFLSMCLIVKGNMPHRVEDELPQPSITSKFELKSVKGKNLGCPECGSIKGHETSYCSLNCYVKPLKRHLKQEKESKMTIASAIIDMRTKS